MRNTGPRTGLGPLQALDKEIIMPVIGWQSKPTKPSKVQGGNTLSRPSRPFRAQLCPDRGSARCSRPASASDPIRCTLATPEGQPQTEAQME